MKYLTVSAIIWAFIVVGIWLASAAARVHRRWHTGVEKRRALDSQKISLAKELLRVANETLHLESEIKRVQEELERARREETESRKALAERPSPPLQEIRVLSEFSSSFRDIPWVAHLKLTSRARARRQNEALNRYVLVWSPDYASAFGRARQLIAEDSDFDVESMRRFDIA